MSKFYTKEERIEFYESEKWNIIKENIFHNRGKICEICKSERNIQVHHLTYERFGGDEIPEDLQILCAKHHMVSHGLLFDKKEDGLFLNKKFIDMTGDIITGILLSQIFYWFLPSKNGKTKLRVRKDGRLWLAKKRTDWWDECRISLKQYIRAIKILESMKLVEIKVFKFNGDPTVHIFLNEDILINKLQSLYNTENY